MGNFTNATNPSAHRGPGARPRGALTEPGLIPNAKLPAWARSTAIAPPPALPAGDSFQDQQYSLNLQRSGGWVPPGLVTSFAPGAPPPAVSQMNAGVPTSLMGQSQVSQFLRSQGQHPDRSQASGGGYWTQARGGGPGLSYTPNLQTRLSQQNVSSNALLQALAAALGIDLGVSG